MEEVHQLHTSFHETHGHLDLLLQRAGDLPSRDLAEHEELDQKTLIKAQEIGYELIKFHELFIQPTVSTDNFRLNYKLWSSIDKIKLLIGSHPEIVNEDFVVSDYLEAQNELLESVLSNPAWNIKVIGFGECGLDYYYSQEPQIKKKQQDLFVEQLMKAQELSVPMVIHCRDAFDDLFGILSEFPNMHGKIDIHCFTGDRDVARQALDFGACFGIGGIITFKNGETLRDAVDFIPLENILIETDLPFLAPVPHRGKDCLPKYIDDVAAVIAEIKDLPKIDAWEKLKSNTKRFYNLH